MPATHDVLNQPPPLRGYNPLREDRALVEALERETGGVPAWLDELGELAGSEEAIAWGFEANANPPQLRTHDAAGNRIDEVTFHPSWHRLMEVATRFGLHGSPWAERHSDAHVLRAAGFFTWSQVEGGHACPISMTYASIPALRTQPDVAQTWEPRLAARAYDPALRWIAGKGSALCGMAMTEKQGGSDVRANTTRARFESGSEYGDVYRLTGHKWFCSAPMSDAFLVLAQTDAGLTCFLMPRILPDGSRNRIFIQRLKDKLGNRANASSEIELDETWALLLGEPGRGVQTIVEMVNYTRLDCINGSAALMRQAVAQATHHAAYRHAFGKALVDQPLMQNVLADLALESEAATAFLFRIAGAVDRSRDGARETAIKRLGTAVGKFYICKRAPAVVAEALECLGGNGYVEESILPRLYREAPLNSIWEGSGNVNALDVLRILAKTPDVLDAYRAELAPALGDARIAAGAKALETLLSDPAETQARAIVERLAVLWQAALLTRYAPSYVADAFVASRLADDGGGIFGTLPAQADRRAIVVRARPRVA